MSIFDINFKNLEFNLKQCGSDWFASQCHGLICARLSVLGPNSLELCLSQIFEHSKKQSEEFNQSQKEIKDLLDSLSKSLSQHNKLNRIYVKSIANKEEFFIADVKRKEPNFLF